MERTNTLIIGASVSGLACAAALQKNSIDYIIIEKEQQVAAPWRNHYSRLHLHTNKRISSLPFLKFGRNVERYPARQQVVDYLENYQRTFDINPVFNTTAKMVWKEQESWITETNNGMFQSKHVVVATGPFGKPKPIHFTGMQSFPGKILHSYDYKTGRDFHDQKVLVVGFGNSACEIAIDLFEQGARPSMAVRSGVNVIPRDLLGIPILEVSMILSKLPAKIADKMNAPILKLLFGDLRKLGLKSHSVGPFEQIRNEGKIPVLDIGTIKHIKQGHIKIYGDINYIEGAQVHFVDGHVESFDAIVAGIGYYRDFADYIRADVVRFQDLNQPIRKQKYFGKDGLYFCGFYIAPTGQIREIASDAKNIARHIYSTQKSSASGG